MTQQLTAKEAKYRIDHWFKDVLLTAEDHEFTYFETFEQAHDEALKLDKRQGHRAWVERKIGDDTWIIL